MHVCVCLPGSDQHHVWLWGADAELPGGDQVCVCGGLCWPSGPVDRVSSFAGGDPGPGIRPATGDTHTQQTHIHACIYTHITKTHKQQTHTHSYTVYTHSNNKNMCHAETGRAWFFLCCPKENRNNISEKGSCWSVISQDTEVYNHYTHTLLYTQTGTQPQVKKNAVQNQIQALPSYLSQSVMCT